MIDLVIKVLAGTLRSYNGVLQLHNRGVSKLRNLQGLLSITDHRRTMANKAMSVENINPNILKMHYAVRGPLVNRAIALKKELKKGATKPFKRVVRANSGDAQAMGQVPISFIRQVMACISYPHLITNGNFPEDVATRSKEILGACGGGSIGAYSQSNGIEMIRRHVAKYIEKRDGFPCHWDNVSLTNGASTGIKNCLQLLCKDVDEKPPGVMIPIPVYPLYTSALAEFGLTKVQYYLNEDDNWSLDEAELERAYAAATNCKIRGLVVINPGNPTGQVLRRKNIETVIKFVRKHNLFLFADEVYQYNIIARCCRFHSFRKVMYEMGSPYNTIEMASFMSASKGYAGECGLRGGWMEIVNFDPDVKAHLYKALSAMLCSNIVGQAVLDCIVRPPKESDPSYNLWKREKECVLNSFRKRARMVEKAFNCLEGFKCNKLQGAMYAFTKIDLPKCAIEAAKKEGKLPDYFYAERLLEETGICVVPGSGFGQKPGTYHFRTTITPKPELLKEMLEKFKKFHEKFTSEFK